MYLERDQTRENVIVEIQVLKTLNVLQKRMCNIVELDERKIETNEYDLFLIPIRNSDKLAN